MKLYPYQEVLVSNVINNLNKKPTVLAAAPGAGKTEMAIEVIRRLLKSHPNLKICILAHGTVILRQQFYDRIKNVFQGKVQDIQNMDSFDSNKTITVALPHAFKKKCPKFDLLIVDEAHEFYFADKYGKDLRDKMKPKQQLLLTGTHFKFTRVNNEALDKGQKTPFHIEMITMNEIIDKAPDQISNLRILVCQSCYDFREMDFNAHGDLSDKFSFARKDTEKTVEKVLNALLKTLNLQPKPISQLRKTMFACHNIKQAYITYNYLKSKGVSVVISVSEADGDLSVLKNTKHDIEQIDLFKKDKTIQALVVVNRAVLGYNHPELENVIDISGTRNIARMYQLMCRAVRAFPDANDRFIGREKLFVKVGPRTSSTHEYTLHLMSATVQLNERYWFEKFDGSNFKHLPIPTMAKIKKQNADASNKRKKDRSAAKPRFYLDVVKSELLFDGIRDTIINNPLTKVGDTTLGKARNILLLGKRLLERDIVVGSVDEAALDYFMKHEVLPERCYV